MLKKIIFLYPNFFLDKDFKRFGSEYYLGKKVHFEVWNILPLIDNRILNLELNKIKETDKVYIQTFLDKISLEKEIRKININNTVVMTTMHLTTKNRWIFDSLQNNRIKWGQYIANLYPEGKIFPLNKIRIYAMNSKLIYMKIISLINRVEQFLFKKNQVALNIYSPSFIIFCGELGKNKSSFHLSNDSLKINTHAFAYNEFIDSKNVKENNSKLSDLFKSKYIVYIDEDVPNHTDPFHHGFNKRLCNPLTFYKEINKFFEFIEKKNNCRVIIAGYPKSNYKNGENPYNREIFFNKTLELIKNSTLVLQHNSTAINYSIMMNKPVVFLSSKNYLLHYRLSILHLADELKSKIIDISREKSWHISDQINNFLYEKYFNNYISSNKNERDKTSHTIIYEKLLRLFN